MGMNDERIRNAMNRRLSALEASPARRARIRQRIAQEEEKKMKKKLSTGLIVALALMLCTVSALAAGLVFSPRYDAGKLANQALLKKYGITEKMMTLFFRKIDTNADGTFSVVYTPSDDSFGVNDLLGVYTVAVKGGKADASWSHDGEQMTEDLSSKVWGAAQLEKLVSDYASSMQYLQSASQGAAAPQARPTPMAQEEVERYAQEARRRAKLSGAECRQIALTAIASEYGLGDAQAKLLVPVFDEQEDGMYFTMEDDKPVGVLIFRLWQGGETWMEKDGQYVVRINVESGEIEDMLYDSGLAANG